MATRTKGQGVLSPEHTEKREEIIELLKTAYWMQLETVMSYITNSVTRRRSRVGDPRGARRGHPGEAQSRAAVRRSDQGALRRRAVLTRVHGRAVVPPASGRADGRRAHHPRRHRGGAGAIEQYNTIIEACDGVDWVTQDLVIDVLRDEEGHRRLSEGFLREYEAEGLA